MIFLDAILSLLLLWSVMLSVNRVADSAREIHNQRTNFYREADEWKKWNSHG
jgi:hypothetical protein